MIKQNNWPQRTIYICILIHNRLNHLIKILNTKTVTDQEIDIIIKNQDPTIQSLQYKLDLLCL